MLPAVKQETAQQSCAVALDYSLKAAVVENLFASPCAPFVDDSGYLHTTANDLLLIDDPCNFSETYEPGRCSN